MYFGKIVKKKNASEVKSKVASHSLSSCNSACRSSQWKESFWKTFWYFFLLLYCLNFFLKFKNGPVVKWRSFDFSLSVRLLQRLRCGLTVPCKDSDSGRGASSSGHSSHRSPRRLPPRHLITRLLHGCMQRGSAPLPLHTLFLYCLT